MFTDRNPIEKCCANKSEPREDLKNVYFNGKRLFATNGNVLAVVPVLEREKEDTPGFIPPEILKKSRTVKGISPRITINGEIKTESKEGFITVPRIEENPLDYVRVIKPVKKAAKKPLFKIAINARMLKDLADALGCESLVLSFSQHQFSEAIVENTLTTEKPIYVEPLNKEDNRFGVIMPIRLE